MTYKKLDVLEQLLGCYLHQDWLDEFENDAAALQAIVELEPREQIVAGIREIDELLAAALSERDLRVILTNQVGCYFDPSSKGIRYEQWLDQVRRVFVTVQPL